MKILIISGFLGAGKTTFIKEMVRATKREFCIFENEFADVNIDGKILKDVETKTGDVNIYEFTEGCICCNMKGDFVSSLLVIANTIDPDFIIIEPSGVGVLSSVMQAISKIEYENIKLLEPITIIDAITYYKYLDKYGDVYADQIKNAKHIQLSKTEQMDKDECENIAKDIRKINPDAIIYTEHYKKAGSEYWDNLFSGELTKINLSKIENDTNMQQVTYKDAKCRDLTELMRFLNRVVLGFFGDICRGKGVILADDVKLRFDLVDGLYCITVAEEEDDNDVVFIGKSIKSINLKADLLKISTYGREVKIRGHFRN